MDLSTIEKKDLYFSRDLSWLEFNWRVLEQALDPSKPLLERLKFVGIYSNNQDEFFMKRVGRLNRILESRGGSATTDGRSAREELDAVSSKVREMTHVKRHCLLSELLPALRDAGVTIHNYDELTITQRNYVDRYFDSYVYPILTPLGVDPAHPFPFISNLSLSLGVKIRRPGSAEPSFARIKVPGNRPRWVPLEEKDTYVPLEQVIAHNLDNLFPGTEILESRSFRVTRNVDLDRNEEEAEDLLEFIQEELRTRRFAEVVRLEIEETASESMVQWLTTELEIRDEEVYRFAGPIGLADLIRFADGIGRPDLKDDPWRPVTPPDLQILEKPDEDGVDIFSLIRQKEILLHHPYHSFNTSVLRFLESAAEDPRVLAIKQTLYRTSTDSPIVQALVRAANNGKQVAVLIEIRARFDEERNIEWVRVLERAGVHVTYGVIGFKTHTKTILIVREEPDGLRSYVHIGTGNYHTGTAKIYTDIGLLSCTPELGADLSDLFNTLTGPGRYENYRKLLVAPTNMRDQFIKMIRREMEKHSSTDPGRIIAKMNSLEDREIINELYRASQAGVSIDLIVRGFCCLRAGVPGMSDNIRVISIVGRFLEHSRIFYFRNGGREEFYIGSADWMYRNLDNRVEAITPIEAPDLRDELRLMLNIMLADNELAWDLQPDGSYIKRQPESGEEPRGTHRVLMQLSAAGSRPSSDERQIPVSIVSHLEEGAGI